MATGHRPVLLEEAVSALQVQDDAVVVDANVDFAGPEEPGLTVRRG